MNISDFLKAYICPKKKINKEILNMEFLNQSSIKQISEFSEQEIYRNECINFFQLLDENTVNQNFIELFGEGTHITINGRSRYGHVKLKLSLSTKKKSEIVWNISEKELLNHYKNQVIESANRFIIFFEHQRKDLKKITVEIIGGSIHPIDSDVLAYEVATRNAIYNSFDKKMHIPNLDRTYKL